MNRLLRTTALAGILGAGMLLALPASAQTQRQPQPQQQAQPQQQTQQRMDRQPGQQEMNRQQAAGTNQCWEQLARFDANGDRVLSVDEMETNRAEVFGVLDRDKDGAVARNEFVQCIGIRDGDQQAVTQAFSTFDTDQDMRLSETEFLAEGVGDQDRARIVVMQSAPTVRVSEAAPNVRVEQQQPQIAVQQPQPEITVQQPQPEVTVQQPQPTVTVQQPQPEVTVRQAQPQVSVQQPPPKVSVEQPQPQVEVQQAEPRVVVEESRPKVTVQQAEPQVTVDQAKPEVSVEQSEPKVVVDQAERPDVRVQQEARVEGEAGRRETESRAATPATGLETGPREAPTTGTATAPTTSQPAGTTAFDLDRFTAEQLQGTDVVNLNGEEVGEIDTIVLRQGGQDPFVVLDVGGGFLGLGGKKVAVPLDRFMIRENDNVILMSEQGESEIKGMPAYEAGQYEPYRW